MSEPLKPDSPRINSVPNIAAPASTGDPRRQTPPNDTVVCERCGKAEMFRMHAVWRCPACGYKTDCCGW